MAAFNILDHLDALKPDGGSNSPNGDRSFHCPACGANNFKVNLSTGKWNGFSCDCSSSESGKRRIREALSPALKPSGLPTPAKPLRPKNSRHWTYTDLFGTPVLRVHRTDDGNGNRKIWQESLLPDKRPAELASTALPYQLLEALKALEYGAPYIYWVEGEPCADALWNIGVPAVTSLGGAGKFKPERDAGHIPPSRLIVVPDQDKPGFSHAKQVAAAHPGCKWLFPFPGSHAWNGAMPDKGGLDIADWITQGATLNDIHTGVCDWTDPNSTNHDLDNLTLAQRIAIGVEQLLLAKLDNDPNKIDATLSELYKLGVARDRCEERALMLWAEKHGLDISTGAKPQLTLKGRILGQSEDTPGLRQQLPGFCIDNDLHLLVSDAGAGKTTAFCELATVMTARDRGFLDHEAPRTDSPSDPRSTALVIASDGEASAYDMWDNYLDTINGKERGAKIEIWAQNNATGETAWNVSLHNLERLVNRLEQGDIAIVIIDTANAIFRGAGVNSGTGPIETYLRLLKQIVCKHCSLWISQHTNRTGGNTVKAIGGHPAFQEVPSAIHLIESKPQADGTKLRIWHVLKLRGFPYRRFSYELTAGELKVTDGHFFQNCREQLLVLLAQQIRLGGFTSPSELIQLSKRPPQSVYQAISELRSLKLIRSKGRGLRLTPSGESTVAALRISNPANT